MIIPNKEGFLLHRFVKLNNRDYYHLYYTNDNHGNPIEERMMMKGWDFVQEKYSYEYDEKGNSILKELYIIIILLGRALYEIHQKDCLLK